MPSSGTSSRYARRTSSSSLLATGADQGDDLHRSEREPVAQDVHAEFRAEPLQRSVAHDARRPPRGERLARCRKGARIAEFEAQQGHTAPPTTAVTTSWAGTTRSAVASTWSSRELMRRPPPSSISPAAGVTASRPRVIGNDSSRPPPSAAPVVERRTPAWLYPGRAPLTRRSSRRRQAAQVRQAAGVRCRWVSSWPGRPRHRPVRRRTRQRRAEDSAAHSGLSMVPPFRCGSSFANCRDGSVGGASTRWGGSRRWRACPGNCAARVGPPGPADTGRRCWSATSRRSSRRRTR